MYLDYGDPCEQFINATDEETVWCTELFENSFIKILDHFCARSQKVMTIERQIFKDNVHSIEKRTVYFPPTMFKEHPDYFTSSLYSERMFERSRNKLAIASLAARIVALRNTVNSIKRNWLKGILDKQFIDSPYLALDLPTSQNINEFEPFSCEHDADCQKVRLEFRYKEKELILNLARSKYGEEIMISFSVFLILLSIILTLKLMITIRQRNQASKGLRVNCYEND
jgi:hypothetical protein